MGNCLFVRSPRCWVKWRGDEGLLDEEFAAKEAKQAKQAEKQAEKQAKQAEKQAKQAEKQRKVGKQVVIKKLPDQRNNEDPMDIYHKKLMGRITG
jgi:sRNA-binding protein